MERGGKRREERERVESDAPQLGTRLARAGAAGEGL